MLNGVEVRLQLIQSKNIFCLHRNAAECKVSLREVILFVHEIKPNLFMQFFHTKALQLAAAKYPLRRVKVKSFTVSMESRSITKENLFLGQLPTRIVVDIVDNNPYNGAIQKSPFNFKHNSINFITICRDSVQIPPNSQQSDFAVICVCFLKLVDIITTLGMLFHENNSKTVVPYLLLI